MRFVTFFFITLFFLFASINIKAQYDKMAWATTSSKMLRQSNLDGSNVENLISTGLIAPKWLSVDENNLKIYFVDGTSIKKCNYDGSGIENVLINLNNPEGIMVDANNAKLYFISAQKAISCDLDGSNQTDLSGSFSYPEGLAIDRINQMLYVTDIDNDQITKIDLTNNSSTIIISGINPVDAAIDNNNSYLYYIDAVAHKIVRTDLNGNNSNDRITGLNGGKGIVIDSDQGYVYWTDDEDQKILRASVSVTGDVTNLINQGNVDVLVNEDGGTRGIILFSYPVAGITNPTADLIIHRYNFDTYITGTRTCAFDGWANAGNIDIRLYVNGVRKSFECNDCGTWSNTKEIDPGTNNIYIESRKDFDPWVASSHRSITFIKPLNDDNFYLQYPGDEYIKIKWSKHTGDGTEDFYYRVCRNTINEANSGDDWTILGNWTQEDTLSDFGVEVGTQYYYWIICASDNSGNNPSAFGTSQRAGTPFPVQLTDFTAEVINSYVSLNWETATEINNYGFEIERLKEENWQKLAFIEGHGNCNSPKKYSFIDRRIWDGTIKYRLKQIDFNGNFKYSDDVVVEIKTQIQYQLFQNYPNPFNPITTIKYEIPIEQNIELSVYNALGRQVKIIEKGYKKAGRYLLEFDGSFLSSGIYYYQLKSDYHVVTKKMLILK